ncbi:SDR family NAD(P)-dependent oxidoreductase [Neorhizobium tomejilense]|uniref:SDR family NAD(P)-dependent oxidoreductase n=1 Tax=Neorhizobium tomejilense TaxID=2093828 RepID=UPI003ED02401
MANSDLIVEGKVVVVTGAGGGIGRTIALLMAEQGAKVVVNDLGTAVDGSGSNPSLAERVAQEIRDAGGGAVANGDSVASWDGAQRIVQTALDAFGRIDVVVNNAGVLRDTIFHKMSPEDWGLSIAVNLTGGFYVSRAAAPHFRAQQSGAFVHISSTSGLVGAMGQANYSAAKMGLVGLSKSIAIDMQRFNVRSNVVAPTAFTRMTESIATDTPEQQERARQREHVPEEKNAPLVVFLASDAAKDVNGQVFYSRKNELIMFSQMRPLSRIHSSTGWTPQSIAEHMLPAFKPSFYPLDLSRDVFRSWLP